MRGLALCSGERLTKGTDEMDDKEKKVRECARTLHQCDEWVRMLGMNNTPIDPDEKMAAFEALAMARADSMRAYNALLRARSNYAR